MKNQFRVEFILDESGSMISQRKTVIDGFNEQIQEMKKEETEKEIEYLISLTKFSGQVEVVFSKVPLSQIREITVEDYNPTGSTALYDAVGKRIETAIEGETNVLVYIFTDGQDNASREFSSNTLKTLIDIRQKQGWGFTYFGANMDANVAAQNIGVVNSVTYDSFSTAEAISATKSVRGVYTQNVNSGLMGMMRSSNLTSMVNEDELMGKFTTTTGKK